MPISGVHDRLGTFKVFIEATDGVGNYNSTIFVGGGAYDSTKSSVEALAKKNATAPELLGWYSGWWYAKKSGLVDVPSFWDDLFAGRTTLQDIVDSLGAIPELVTHTGAHYDAAYLDYMRTLALSVNPYVPTLEDLTNLANDSLTFWMRDDGAQKVNASAWLKFAKAFWDGSVAGGIDTAVGTTLASMVLGGAMGAALRAIPIVARILGTIKLVMAAALTVIKTILQKVVSAAFKAVTLLAGKLWMATRAAASLASEALHGFVLRTVLKLGADGVAHRIMQAFGQRAHDFATWWGTTVDRISDAASGVADAISENLRLFLGDARGRASGIGNPESSARGTADGGWRAFRPNSQTFKLASQFKAVDIEGKTIRGLNVKHMNARDHFRQLADKFGLWSGNQVDMPKLLEKIREAIEKARPEPEFTQSGLPARVYEWPLPEGKIRVTAVTIGGRTQVLTAHPA